MRRRRSPSRSLFLLPCGISTIATLEDAPGRSSLVTGSSPTCELGNGSVGSS